MSESTMTTDEWGNKVWISSRGQFHRIGGPAIEYPDGYKAWLINGKRHRLNGPAIEHSDGSKTWCINGELLGINDEGFWELWDLLTPEQKQDPILLSYLPTL